jgi:predicted transcriptional regulator
MNDLEKKAVELVKNGERVQKVARLLGVSEYWLKVKTGHEI